MQKFYHFISNNKLRNMTPITGKNIGKVMGQINRFFKKPSKQLTNFTNVVGYEDLDMGFGVCHRPIIDTTVSIPVYHAYIDGKCDVHWLQNDSTYQIFSSEPPMLAVTSSFAECCIPIYVGAKYKIFGDRLVIMDKNDSSFHGDPDTGRWMRYSEWVHVPEEELEEYNQQAFQEKMEFLIYKIVLTSYDVAQLFRLPTCPHVIDDELYRVNDEIREDIAEDFAAGGVRRYDYKLNETKFSLQIDFDKWKLEGDRDSFFFTMDGKKITLYEIIKATFQKEINKAIQEV